jgi:hypothetical protein
VGLSPTGKRRLCTAHAIKSHSSHSSSFQVCLPWFLGTGHWIGGTLFSRLIGSNAASAGIGDDEGMGFE